MPTSPNGRRIAVVGTVLVDRIEGADGQVTRALGGIAHVVAALSALADGDLEIVPCTVVGDDLRNELVGAWERPGVILDALQSHPGPHPHNHLSYGESGTQTDRVERLVHQLPPLGDDDLAAAREADLVLVDSITGEDCTTDALASLGAEVPVHLDFHGRALRRRPDGRRVPARPLDWRRWVQSAEVLQCNEAEAATLAGRPGEILEDDRELASLAAAVLSRDGGRPGLLVVTRAERGAVALERKGGRIVLTRVAAPEVDVVDPTGAGDAFGAGFCRARLGGADLEASLAAGVLAGTAACAFTGPPPAEEFRETVARLEAG